MAAETGDPPQLQTNRLAVERGFDGGDERCFTRRATSPFAAGAFAPDVGVVDLDPPGQLLGGIAFEHDVLQLVLDLPGRGCVTPRGRPSSMLEMPCLVWVK
jgi:hypothetical protein